MKMTQNLAIPDEFLQRCLSFGNVVVLTGAGISAESGIPTFRGAGGLWRNYRAEDLATLAAFRRDPVLVWEWYQMRREICGTANPNPAHEALVEMESVINSEGHTFLLVTQNVDGLHRRAGSRAIIEIHGSIWKTRCLQCQAEREQEISTDLPPRCVCGGLLRPAVLWFGETYDPAQLEMVGDSLRRADLLLVIGSSGQVSVPVALARDARKNGAYVLELNAEPSEFSRIASGSIFERAGVSLPVIWNTWRDLRSGARDKQDRKNE